MINVMCVWTGEKYPFEYVVKLHNMVQRHADRPFRFTCVTDRTDPPREVSTINFRLRATTKGWWTKLELLNPHFRGRGRTVYFDLDTVICGPLGPLFDVEAPTGFATCANFTRRAGNEAWPCQYGSCVMVFEEGFGQSEYCQWFDNRAELEAQAGRYGDQLVYEWLKPDATLLQDQLPPGYFLGRREFTETKPEGVSIAVFAGRHRPDNCEFQWLREEWK